MILARNLRVNLIFQCQGSGQNSSPVHTNVFLFFIRSLVPSTLIRSKTEHMCMKKDVFRRIQRKRLPS